MPLKPVKAEVCLVCGAYAVWHHWSNARTMQSWCSIHVPKSFIEGVAEGMEPRERVQWRKGLARRGNEALK